MRGTWFLGLKEAFPDPIDHRNMCTTYSSTYKERIDLDSQERNWCPREGLASFPRITFSYDPYLIGFYHPLHAQPDLLHHLNLMTSSPCRLAQQYQIKVTYLTRFTMILKKTRGKTFQICSSQLFVESLSHNQVILFLFKLVFLLK